MPPDFIWQGTGLLYRGQRIGEIHDDGNGRWIAAVYNHERGCWARRKCFETEAQARRHIETAAPDFLDAIGNTETADAA